MTTRARPETRLEDYTPPRYLVDRVDLRFELGDPFTTVRSRLSMRRNPGTGDTAAPLVLDGEGLDLVRLRLDGRELRADAYAVDDAHLTVPAVPARFTLESEVRIAPGENRALEGLYRSGATYCTQCEAEGFRKITYYLDRPDVMARFTTTIVAERERCPVLLSNGNPVAAGAGEDGRHWATWEDPFPKPCYLFALVAGDLACVEDGFVTRSGRKVALRIYTEPHNRDRCGHALASLARAMRWDEEVFGREYDLDIYMIVAVDDFNMGAMENKGLNLFNSRYVLARPETATDDDYAAIEGVVAHEYFHNWTGNRITCRDWFQLSLKEGLTVFRDQEFSADMGSRPVKRINDVRVLRNVQFREDAGAMAHPVRPDSYLEINNFYTVTVYNKGAEVIRMMHTLLGAETFRAGMDLYFERHDGEAVTTDDFVRAMEDASGIDLRQFRRWYDQAGTPEIEVTGAYDPAAREFTLTVTQRCPATPGQPDKRPFHFPLAIGLLDRGGDPVPARCAPGTTAADGMTCVVPVREPRQTFTFREVPSEPVPSLLRGFSAPVRLGQDRPREELAFLAAHDPDPFGRWDAGHALAVREILDLVAALRAGRPPAVRAPFVDAVARTLGDGGLDRALVAETLALPSEGYLAEQMEVVDVDAIHRARRCLRAAVARALRERLQAAYRANRSNEPYRFDPESAARRALGNACLGYLMELDDEPARRLCVEQLGRADNMTDALAALRLLANSAGPERTEALAAFEHRWRDDPLVLDKWFEIQATSRQPEALADVRRLMTHAAFERTNPNRVRALVGAFCHANPVRFHAAGGEGYRFLTEQILDLDPINPQVTARLARAFARWRKFDPARQALMHAEMERIANRDNLSRDTYEILSKILD